jgi:hypothetical protein
MEIRVSSLPILRRYRRWIGGSPRSLALPVASPDVAAGCPAHRTFGFCRRSIFRLPRIPNPFGASSGLQVPGSPATLYFARCASRCITGCPGVCIFRPCRRPIIEFPRISYPSTHLLRQLQVAPLPRSSSCACRYSLRVAPASASSGFAGNGSSSYPESLVLRRLQCLSSRLPSNSAPPGCASRCRCEFPRQLHPPAWPQV